MNRENIEYTIELLRNAQNFNIEVFQHNRHGNTVVTSIEELHTCGNTACIAGYVALSPRWKELGGIVNQWGEPITLEKSDEEEFFPEATVAMSKFWGLSLGTTDSIIYGDAFWRFVEHQGITGMPERWTEMTKEEAVKIFEHLLEHGEVE